LLLFLKSVSKFIFIDIFETINWDERISNDFLKGLMGKLINEFNSYRSKMNEKILASDNKVMKRLYSLDALTYQEGALSAKTKEMLGLATSMVLRCDDCIKYHLEKCYELGVTTDEMFELFGVANLVGGSIVIPHTRRAVEFWEELNDSAN
jgi:AhpD family alkylhydroperoxidase